MTPPDGERCTFVSERPRLLFLCQTLPYPLDGGVWIRTFHVMRLLARTFDVTALCFERSGASGSRGEYNVPRSVAELSRVAAVEAFELRQNHSRIRYVSNHVRSLLSRSVYTRFMYESVAFRARVEEILGEAGADLVHADSLDLSAYLPACEGVPTVCVHHNIESELLRRRSRFEGGRLTSRYYELQAEWMRQEEAAWAPRVALNVMVSDTDRATLETIAPSARTTVVPNGVDVDEFQPGPGRNRGIVYVGGTNWFPNLDALEFFCGGILPGLDGVAEAQPIRWVGSATEEEQVRYRERHGVELTGYVDDVRQSMRDAMCHVVPLRVGGGTRLKILNSWAMGKPVVSTSVGCEGLQAVDGENILIRDDPAEFAEAIRRLAGDPELRKRLGENARRTAVEVYSWEVVGEQMVRTYMGLLRGGAVPASAGAPVPGQSRTET
jgi:glycosyltransferase involved in cell wall biosynthesis